MNQSKVKSKDIINVGSRSSQLALIQTNIVLDKIKLFYENNPAHLKGVSSDGFELNIVSMTTAGDRILDKPLPEIGAKSLFTKDLEVALMEGKVDFIVHSLKDLPTKLPDGCVIGAVMKRDDPNDTIVLKKSIRSHAKPLDLLLGQWKRPAGQKVKIGTSSPRRISMARRINPELECVDIRGNLNTRFAKLDNDDSDYDAIILAKAGLERMGWSDRAEGSLSPQEDERLVDWCYAVGQGAIAVECRMENEQIMNLLAPIIDLKTTYEAIAERSLMRKLEGGCSVPLGVRSSWDGMNILTLQGILLSRDGKIIHKAKRSVVLSNNICEDAQQAQSQLASLTTGITLPSAILNQPSARSNLVECNRLGVDVASEMIESGCLELIKHIR